MIIDKVHLQNFRSYTDQTVAFGPGISLFEGDIGSGKSSLLFAVEFALFGLADVPGEHLLRAGEKEGLIELTFRSGGKRYTVGRRLVRGKAGGATQKDAYLLSGDSREDLSVEQLRAAVIKILGFRESPSPKSKSQVFRYGVFTPQEEMKAILEQGAEERKQTLRRAFGIEEFKRARENADIVKSALRERAGALEILLAHAPRLEQERAEAAAMRDGIARQLEEAERQRETAYADHKRAEEALKASEILEKRERELERELSQMAANRGKLQERLVAADKSLAEIHATEAEAVPLRPLAARLPELDASLKEAEARAEARRKQEESVKLLDAKVASLTQRREELAGESEMLRKVLENSEAVLQGQRELAAARQELDKNTQHLARAREAQKRSAELQHRLASLEREAAKSPELEKSLANAAAEAAEVERAQKALEKLEETASEAQAAQGGARARLDRLEADLEELSSLSGKAKCPKCRQPLDGEHLKTHRAETEAAITDARKLLAQAQGRVRALEKERASLAKARDDGEKAARAREGLAAELRRAQQAAEEARKVRGELQEAQAAAAQAEALGESRKRLEGEIRQKAVFDKRAGEIESARRRWNDLSGLIAKAKREIDEGTRAARGVRQSLTGEPTDPRKMVALKAEVQGARDAATRLHALERKLASKGDVERSKVQAASELDGLNQREAGTRGQFDALRAKLAEKPLAAVREAFQKASAARAAVDERLKAAREGLARQVEALERAEARLLELGSQRVDLDRLRHSRDFLEQFFQVALEEIEVQVLGDVNAQFNLRFQEYFGKLMEGAPVDVQIDAEFSPEVLQGPHSLPVNALSGGERTSVALAYRLALNTLVSRAAGMETPDLLILDEPTDGFSKEQLARVGELLRTLDCQQVILVSHERELESCADHVFEVTKEGTVSRVAMR